VHAWTKWDDAKILNELFLYTCYVYVHNTYYNILPFRAHSARALQVHLKQDSIVSVQVDFCVDTQPPQGTNCPPELASENPSTPGMADEVSLCKVVVGFVKSTSTGASADVHSVMQ